MQRLILSMAAVGMLVVLSVGAAFAQTPSSPADQPGWGHMGVRSARGYGNYDPASNPTIKRVADKIGIGAAHLVKELQSGKSVAEVAKGRNVDEQTLVDLLLAPQTDTLAMQVRYGYLTQDQANAIQKVAPTASSTSSNKRAYSAGSARVT